MDATRPLGHEWSTLQRDHERHERTAVLVKVAAVFLAGTVFVVAIPAWVGLLLIAALWLQEAMLRTVQARLGDRLLRVETLMAEDPDGARGAYRFHTEWAAQRGGAGALLAEYLGAALRPTVAFPYPLLIVLVFVGAWG